MPGAVVGVASESDVLVLHAEAPSAKVIALLQEQGVAGKQLHVYGSGTTIVISRENLHGEDRLREALDMNFGDRARLVDGFGAVSVIGAGINATYANVIAGTRALEASGVFPSGIATSSFRITWMVPRVLLQEAVRAMHALFIEGRT
jgi:aspartate kinase